ncbi:glycosyltransferase [[Clostridium] innocuum]|nr:glycosyltransferase [[Clostridium] innocuum]
MAEISVIMSVYNDAVYLQSAIDSILSQTFTDFEFIVCNDCSTDCSLKILEGYKDRRIKIIQNTENMGLAASLNKCIKISSAPYIARMDSDDISMPDRLKTEYDFLKEHSEYDVVGSKCNVIDENGNVYKEFLIHNAEVTLLDALKKVCVIHPTVLMRRRPVEEVGGYTVSELTSRAEDYDLWCKLLSNNHRIFNLDKTLLCYREGLSGIKKRKYKYRIQEAKLKYHWMKREGAPKSAYLFILKPLLIGMIPLKLMSIYKRKHQ